MGKKVNINQVEQLTGVSKRNIRFYEKEGLLTPERNPKNGYRSYDEADIRRIQLIKMLRMVDMPLEEIKKIFYTSLYHTMIMPTNFTDLNGEYLGFDKEVHTAEGYTYRSDMSLWDTVRNTHALYTLIEADVQNDCLNSIVEMAKAGGALPRWPQGAGYSGSMFGDSANMIIKNTWQSKTVAKISEEVRDGSEVIYTLFVFCDNLVFRMELMNFNNMLFWYVSPQTRSLKNEDETRIISDKASINPLHTNGFLPLSDRERTVFGLIKQNKVFYCSNSCGTDFQQVLKKYHVLFV